MNETITLKNRQKKILNLLAQQPNLSSTQLNNQLSILYSVSKATLARDLQILTNQKLISKTGKGPSTTYKPINKHPLLPSIDLDQYFAIESDNRLQANSSFNPQVFKHLNNLLLQSEKTHLKKIHQSFSKATSKHSSAYLKRELERYVIDLSWKSSHIEGNTYTLLETETLLKQNLEASGHTREEAIMILNHKTTFENIFKHKADFKRLTMSAVIKLHSLLTQNLKVTPGIRTRPVRITGTPYKPLSLQPQIQKNLERIIKLINQTKHPIEKVIISNSLVAYLQPFMDGNKRTSRMLGNAILLAHDHFPLSFRNIDENEYKQALVLFYETNNLHHLKRLILEQYQFALSEYFI
ncbi:MAG: Fic family protein [Candidatus Beckwithbacteria bacterium]|nr:Fic family protein [Patescibacteria group bacterium]